MTYDQFIKGYVVSGTTYTSDEVIALIQSAWNQAVNEQVRLERRCENKNSSPWNCKSQDFRLHTQDCPTPPDRECVADCLRRCPPSLNTWQVSSQS